MAIPPGFRTDAKPVHQKLGTPNRLTSITQDGAPWGHYTYDPRGNMIDKTGQTLVFDRANRLTQITNVANYEYDGHGRRTSQWRADGTVRVSLYTLDGRLQGEADNRAVGSTDYMYLGSTLVAKRFQHWSGSPPVVTYQHSDGLGSPVLETDTNGAVVSRERFLSYGGAVDGAVNDTVGYTGHQEDPASGLVYMQQRYYDPSLGVFLSIDPIGSLNDPIVYFNRYRYANSNPYAVVDRDGRCGSDAFQEVPDGSCLPAPQASANADSPGKLASLKKTIKREWKNLDIAKELSAIPGEGAAVRGGSALLHGAQAAYLAIARAQKGQHIVLGLRNFGLKETAKRVGGETLLGDPAWRQTLIQAVNNPATRFTVSVEGLTGTSVFSKVTAAITRPGASATNWELAQLAQANRLKDVTFVDGLGTVLKNPFAQ